MPTDATPPAAERDWARLPLPDLAWILATSPFAGTEGDPIHWRMPTVVATAGLVELFALGLVTARPGDVDVRLTPPDDRDPASAASGVGAELLGPLHRLAHETLPITAALRALHAPVRTAAGQDCLRCGLAAEVERGRWRRRTVLAPPRSVRDALTGACRDRIRDPFDADDRLSLLIGLTVGLDVGEWALSPTPMPDIRTSGAAFPFADAYPYPEVLDQAKLAMQVTRVPTR